MVAMEFYGPNGEPDYFAKQKKALTGELVTHWGGNSIFPSKASLPRKLNLTFDTEKLDVADFRVMCDHPQIAASISVLSFMMYQRDWRIVGDNAKANKHCEENLRNLWPRVVRAMSTAFWAGFSPCALQWENDLPGGKTWVTKIKDLDPEECKVRWKDVTGVVEKKEGVNTPYPKKTKVFDGIMQPGVGPDIPVTNSFWYPLLMSQGDYYGKKLFKSAFQPWYFSLLMHLYANRYFERFAEPTMLGRAPFDDTIRINGKDVPGNRMMATVMSRVRSGNGALLPSSQSSEGLNGEPVYDYTLDFLESQLRGVDYERYLMRLDDEISMAMFTPLLMMRQADVGSSNLGVVHTATYQVMLNAISGDWEEYINRYLIIPMCQQNRLAGERKWPRIEFRPLGKMDGETMRALLQMVIGGNKAKISDLSTLGAAAGLELEEIKEVLPDPITDNDPNLTPVKPNGEKKDDRIGRPGKNVTPKGTDKVTTKVAAEKIAVRLQEQSTKAVREGTWHNGYVPDLGYRRQVIEALDLDEWEAGEVYGKLQYTVTQLADAISSDDFVSAARSLILGILTEAVERAPAYA